MSIFFLKIMISLHKAKKQFNSENNLRLLPYISVSCCADCKFLGGKKIMFFEPIASVMERFEVTISQMMLEQVKIRWSQIWAKLPRPRNLKCLWFCWEWSGIVIQYDRSSSLALVTYFSCLFGKDLLPVTAWNPQLKMFLFARFFYLSFLFAILEVKISTL